MKIYRPKQDWVESFVRGRSVLDLGCVDHSLDRVDRPWLHDTIVSKADRVVGVDLLEEPVAALQRRGYDVRLGDVQDLHLDETFDVVVAGDIIEHLENPGGLFDTAERRILGRMGSCRRLVS